MSDGALVERIEAALEASGVEYEIFPCDPELADTAVFCERYGYPLKFREHHPGQGEDRRRTLRRLRGPRQHPTRREPHVRKRLGARRVSFASADETRTATGMEIGESRLSPAGRARSLGRRPDHGLRVGDPRRRRSVAQDQGGARAVRAHAVGHRDRRACARPAGMSTVHPPACGCCPASAWTGRAQARVRRRATGARVRVRIGRMDSSLRGNNGNSAVDVIPAKAGIHGFSDHCSSQARKPNTDAGARSRVRPGPRVGSGPTRAAPFAAWSAGSRSRTRHRLARRDCGTFRSAGSWERGHLARPGRRPAMDDPPKARGCSSGQDARAPGKGVARTRLNRKDDGASRNPGLQA